MKSIFKILVFISIVFASNVAMACPDCKSALRDGLAFGYAASILMMMGMPFLIMAWWAYTVWKLRRNFTKQHETFAE